MRRIELAIPCGEIILEGVTHLPKASGPLAAVVVCHPHPLYGGDMHNHLVVTLCQALAESGIVALRFNFRGTGRSGGRHGQGMAEQEDVLAALASAEGLEGVDNRRLGLAGYSFGALVAAAAAARMESLRALALISPPQGLERQALVGFLGAKLIVSGQADAFAPAEELRKLAQGLGESCECVILPGVDHFWSYGLDAAAARVVAFFRKNLEPRT